MQWNNSINYKCEALNRAPESTHTVLVMQALFAQQNGGRASTIVNSEPEVLMEFQDVHKSFGSKAILKGASFKIYRGEAVGIIGASGSGKSTTLRLAAGLLMPDKVEIMKVNKA